jgi:hypothetical protein
MVPNSEREQLVLAVQEFNTNRPEIFNALAERIFVFICANYCVEERSFRPFVVLVLQEVRYILYNVEHRQALIKVLENQKRLYYLLQEIDKNRGHSLYDYEGLHPSYK